MKSSLLVSLGLALTLSTNAGDLPPECKTDQISYSNDQIILHTALTNAPQVVFIQNISDDEIIINHVVRYPSVSAGWASYLRPKHWSALMIAQPKFTLSCSKMEEEKFTTVDCSQRLQSCYYSQFEDEEHAGTGTYWLAEDKLFDELVSAIAKRKIMINSLNMKQAQDIEDTENNSSE